MKMIQLTLCFLLPFLLLSQEDLAIVFPIDKDSGKTEFLLADQVALRSNPSLSGQLLTRLKIGSQLLLKNKNREMMTQNGIASHWYQVEVNGRTGWLWGGLIAAGTKYGTCSFEWGSPVEQRFW